MTDPQTPTGDEPQAGASEPVLYNTVYCSRAATGVGENDVDRIVDTARRHNAAHGITGLLVFGSGIFFQWLEGPREPVTRLMARLRTDPRHQDVLLLAEGEEQRERLFPDWDMERVDADAIRDVLADARQNAGDAGRAALLDALLGHLDATALAPPGPR